MAGGSEEVGLQEVRVKVLPKSLFVRGQVN